MRLTFAANRKVANAKYNEKHPKRSTKYRHLQIAKKGKTVKANGRPKKRQLNFNANLLMQNRNVIAKEKIDFELEEDEGVDGNFRLKRSKIHGLGVFYAARDLAKDAVLMEYRGETITHTEADTREAEYTASGLDMYLFSVNTDTVIDATKRGNLARFINHSCSPNCESVGSYESDTIQIVSLQPIKYGSEITIDYHMLPYKGGYNAIVQVCVIIIFIVILWTFFVEWPSSRPSLMRAFLFAEMVATTRHKRRGVIQIIQIMINKS